jgi:hypothetical protein
MNDSFKKELEDIKAATPTSVKSDPFSLLYGILFIVMGFVLISVDKKGFGILMILVGGIGVLAGGASFVWKSPKVKLFQAADSFVMALLFLLFLTMDRREGIIKSPIVCLGIAAFLAWVGYGNLKEYSTLKKLEEEHRGKKE